MIQFTKASTYLIYIVLLLIYVALGLFAEYSTKRYYKLAFIFFQTNLLIVFCSFRYGIGTDYFSYRSAFFDISYYGMRFEPLYKSLNQAVLFLFNDYRVLLFICSSITLPLINFVYLKLSRNYALSSFLFISCWFFFESLNAVRQFIAIGFVLFACYWIYQNRKTLFMLFGSMAVLFHYSAAVALVIFLVFWILKKKQRIYTIVLIALSIVALLYDILISRYSGYLFLYEHFLRIDESIGIKPMLFHLIILLPAFALVGYSKCKDSQILVPLLMSVTGVLFFFLLTKNIFFYRISFYFSIFETILLPNYLSLARSRIMSLILVISLILYGLLSFYLGMRQNNSGVIPLSFAFIR
jgi:transmembrane protein EpsG